SPCLGCWNDEGVVYGERHDAGRGQHLELDPLGEVGVLAHQAGTGIGAEGASNVRVLGPDGIEQPLGCLETIVDAGFARERVSDCPNGAPVRSGVDADQQRQLDLLAGSALDLVGIADHPLAGFLIEQPHVQCRIVDLDRLLAIDRDLVSSALRRDVLPMPAIEAAAEIEATAIEYAMELSLCPTAIIEAVAFPNYATTFGDLLRCQSFIQRP